MNQKYLLLFFIAILSLGYTSCIKIPDQYMGPPPGKWRATLNLDGIRRPLNKDAKPRAKETLQFEDVTEGELPFTFDVVYDNPDKIHINIYNGDEVIKVEDVVFGWERGTGNDTIIIDFPHYDSYITALFEENVIEGKYIVKTRENYAIPFVAKFGEGHRFSTLKKTPKIDVSGKWEVNFGIDTDEPYPAIGEFKQDGNHLLGTFITETGDYRFLEGTIQDDKIYLSCFDGSHAFLFEAKILEDETMTGIFRSGSHYQTSFNAKRNDKFQLENPEKMTFLKEGFDELSFSFPNESGVDVSLNDETFKGKYKIVQILGTWCPNCADETEFLTQYFKENPNENIEVIGLAFEKHKEKEKAFRAISRFKKRFDVDYPVLWAGSSNKELAGKALPMLNKVISYPTMIFLDKDNKVIKIHTGFYGPATSKYKEFEEDFDKFVQNLTKD
jgi:thiol-disulfide isomerase/thioredoxin